MESIELTCMDDGKQYVLPCGGVLSDIAPESVTDPKTGKSYPVLNALVDNQLKSLDFRCDQPHKVAFIGYNHPDGRRSYCRSLSFLLQVAVRHLFPDKVQILWR